MVHAAREKALNVTGGNLIRNAIVAWIATEYDMANQRLVGNFPQAFSHLALVNTARNLTRAGGPAEDRLASAEAQSKAADET